MTAAPDLRTAPGPCARRARRLFLAVAAGLVLSLAACSSDDPGGAEPAPSGSSARPSIAEADGVRVEATATPHRVRVGDPLELSIIVTAPPGTTVDMPAPTDRALGPFTVEAQRRPPDVPLGDGRRRWSHDYVLATFDAGSLEIPALTVTYDTLDGQPTSPAAPADPAAGPADPAPPRELTVGPIPIEVVSVLGDEPEPQLRELTGFVDLPTSTPWWWWASGGVVVALVVGLLVLFVTLRRRHRLGTTEAAAAPVAADAWARTALDALDRANLPARGAVHEYFFRLSDIVREYIERRFGLDATDRTTDEFIREMHAHPVLETNHQQLLGSFLRSADMVKFARHEPPVDECTRAMRTARSFVDETAPSRSVPAGAGSDLGAAPAAAAHDDSGTAA